jgi:hypothetical protein
MAGRYDRPATAGQEKYVVSSLCSTRSVPPTTSLIQRSITGEWMWAVPFIISSACASACPSPSPSGSVVSRPSA